MMFAPKSPPLFQEHSGCARYRVDDHRADPSNGPEQHVLPAHLARAPAAESGQRPPRPEAHGAYGDRLAVSLPALSFPRPGQGTSLFVEG